MNMLRIAVLALAFMALPLQFGLGEKLRIMLPLTIITSPAEPAANLEKMQQAKADLQQLVGIAKKEKLSEPVLLLLRSGIQKLTSNEAEEERQLAKLKASEEKKAAELQKLKESEMQEKVAPPAVFASELMRGVRPLKSSMRAPEGRKGSVNEHEVSNYLETEDFDLSLPFVVRRGLEPESEFGDAIRRKLTLSQLRKIEDVTLDYYEPKLAREMVAEIVFPNGGAIQDYSEDPLLDIRVPKKVDFVQYFALCFGSAKIPGSQTDHCQQSIPEHQIFSKPTLADAGLLNVSLGETENAFRATHAARLALLKEIGIDKNTAALRPILGGGAETAKILRNQWTAGTRDGGEVVLGPAGSGKAGGYFLTATKSAEIDALVHGSRRWLVVDGKEIKRIKKERGESFQPSPFAFGFFETTLADWREDNEMSVLAEFNQGPGDVVYLPPGSHAVVLAVEDSVSIRRVMHLPDAVASVDRIKSPSEIADQMVWDTKAGFWDLMACVHPIEKIEHFPGWDPKDHYLPHQVIEAYQAASDVDKCKMAARAALRCAGAAAHEPSSLCAQHFGGCVATLRQSAAAVSGASVQAFLDFTERHEHLTIPSLSAKKKKRSKKKKKKKKRKQKQATKEEL